MQARLNRSFDRFTARSITVHQPNFQAVSVDAPDTVPEGQSFEVSITVANRGSSVGNGVTLVRGSELFGMGGKRTIDIPPGGTRTFTDTVVKNSEQNQTVSVGINNGFAGLLQDRVNVTVSLPSAGGGGGGGGSGGGGSGGGGGGGGSTQPEPGEFEALNLQNLPSKVRPGERFTFQVRIRCQGGRCRDGRVRWGADGGVRNSRSLQNASQGDTFTEPLSLSLSDPGSHSIRALVTTRGGFASQATGTVEVAEPPEINIRRVNILESNPPAGQPVQVNIVAENTGGFESSKTFDVLVGDVTQESVSFTVPPGATREQQVTLIAPNDPQMTVNVGGARAQVQVDQPTPANIQVTNVRIDTSPPDVGDQVPIVVEAKNEGEQTGQASFPVTINGQQQGTVSFNLAGLSEGTQRIRRQAPDSNRMVVSVGGQTDQIEVLQPQGGALPPGGDAENGDDGTGGNGGGQPGFGLGDLPVRNIATGAGVILILLLGSRFA